MKKIYLLLIPLMAAIAVWNLSSCLKKPKYHEDSNGGGNKTTKVEEETSKQEAPAEEFLGGRTPWEEFYIDSQQHGYANVREYTTTDSPVVKEIETGEHFYGWRMEDNPDWIEVYDDDGNTIGYMYYYCARHTGNKSTNREYSEPNRKDEPADNEKSSENDFSSKSLGGFN